MSACLSRYAAAFACMYVTQPAAHIIHAQRRDTGTPVPVPFLDLFVTSTERTPRGSPAAAVRLACLLTDDQQLHVCPSVAARMWLSFACIACNTRSNAVSASAPLQHLGISSGISLYAAANTDDACTHRWVGADAHEIWSSGCTTRHLQCSFRCHDCLASCHLQPALLQSSLIEA